MKYQSATDIYSDIGKDVLFTLEHLHYTDIYNQLKERRKKISNMTSLYREFVNFYIPTGKEYRDVSFACISCLKNKINHVRHSSQCNAKCEFCYFYGQVDPSRFVPQWAYRESSLRSNMNLDEIMIMLHKQILPQVDAIGWLEKEPLINLEKMQPVMGFISNHGKYQYLYTNGILANEETLKKLNSWGLNEIRFNLQATDFSQQVLDHLTLAGKIFEYVCIETPLFSKSFNNFKKHKSQIIDSGVKQINAAELQLTPFNMDVFKDEGEIYRSRRGYVSPVSSRHYVYDLIELADDEKWDIIINDCSNDTKFFRGVAPDSGIHYETCFKFLPYEYYLKVIDKYVGKELII